MAARVVTSIRVPQTSSDANEYTQATTEHRSDDPAEIPNNEDKEVSIRCQGYGFEDDYLPISVRREEPKLPLYAPDESQNYSFCIERRLDSLHHVGINSNTETEFGLGGPQRYVPKEHEGIPVRTSAGNHACAPAYHEKNATPKKEKPLFLIDHLSRMVAATSAVHLILIATACTVFIRDDPTKILDHIGSFASV